MGTWALMSVFLTGCVNGLGQVMMRAAGRGMPSGELPGASQLAHQPLWTAGVVICWCCGLFWAWLVPRVSLAAAFPVYLGVAFTAIALGGHFWLGEPIRLRDCLAFALILAGIALVARPR